MPIPEALHPHLSAIAGRAASLDEQAVFPQEDVALLCTLGLHLAPLPTTHGGQGLGTDPARADDLLDLLRALGRANLSLGRIFEAHVNTVRLAFRFGTPAHLATIAATNELFGLWVTDAPNHPLTRTHGILQGAKGPGSGATHLRHALITVSEHGATRMALLALHAPAPTTPIGARLQGMRASANATIDLTGMPLPDHALFGADGDYLREPDLSTGAWRAMAVTLGGLDALVDAVRTQLRARDHDQAPLQQARFGEILIAHGTAELWTRHAAQTAETATAPIPDQVATVNLARLALESAAFDIMRHAQRALGLAAFVRPNPVERLLRDLATFLRQPAPDDVLLTAARHGLAPHGPAPHGPPR